MVGIGQLVGVGVATRPKVTASGNGEDLRELYFSYPITWVFDGNRTYTLPDGGEENWILSRINNATWRTLTIKHAFETYPDLKQIVLKEGWGLEIGEIIRLDLIFIYG